MLLHKKPNMAVLPEVKKSYGRLKNYVDGEFVTPTTEKYDPVYNPAKDEVIAEVPMCVKEDVDAAVEAAVNAFEEWKEVPITTRVRYLFELKNALEGKFEELSRVTTQNHGKIIDEARGEMRRLIENVETAIAIAYTLFKGERLDQIATGIDEELVREPLGAFGVIGPFNFPALAPFWYIPYAMAVGATLVVKPSEICPIPMSEICQIFDEINLPPGVVNIVHGGKEVGEELIKHPDIQGVTFVGSTPVGRAVYRLAGEYGKRALVQAGAKNYVVVMPDVNLNKAVPNMLASFFGNSGQRCLAGANLAAVGEVYDELKKKFVEAASKLKLGYGLDESVGMGPVVSRKAKERILWFIEKGIEEGAKLILDGRNPKVPDYPNGYFVGPTVFDDVTPDMTIAKEEIFGPVAAIIRFDTLDDAIEVINKSKYGNAAVIYTSSGAAERKFTRSVKCGNVGVNVGIPAPMAFFPFAGMRESFFGVLHGQIDCVDFFADRKVIIKRWLD